MLPVECLSHLQRFLHNENTHQTSFQRTADTVHAAPVPFP